jgi:hypothetical protein
MPGGRSPMADPREQFYPGRCAYFRIDCLLQEAQGVWHACSAESTMTLLLYYLVFMIVGDFAAYFLGLLVERMWGSQASLIVFLTLYFGFLWVSWLFAVWATKPRVVAQPGAGPGQQSQPVS